MLCYHSSKGIVGSGSEILQHEWIERGKGDHLFVQCHRQNGMGGHNRFQNTENGEDVQPSRNQRLRTEFRLPPGVRSQPQTQGGHGGGVPTQSDGERQNSDPFEDCEKPFVH